MKLPTVGAIPIPTEEGKWYALRTPELTECCGCGLVHHTEYVLENGRLFWRAILDVQATNAARTRSGITVTEKAPVRRSGAALARGSAHPRRGSKPRTGRPR
jgi:hypothetical protein